MQVSKVKLFEQLPTSTLRERFYEEWERVSKLLIRVYPISNDSLNMILEELISLYEELERRKEPIYQ